MFSPILLTVLALGTASAQLTGSLSWSVAPASLTFAPTARAYAVLSRNSTHLFALGGEGSVLTSNPTALAFNIGELREVGGYSEKSSKRPSLEQTHAPLHIPPPPSFHQHHYHSPHSAGTGSITGEFTIRGDSVPADRAAWTLVEPPVNTLAVSNAGVIGAGSYTAAFGGIDGTGKEVATLAYYYPDSNSWVTQNQTGGSAATPPAARQGGAMAYLRNCYNATGCLVLFGGATNAGATVLGDTNAWWPTTRVTPPASVCGSASVNAVLTLTCPANQFITAVPFASFGAAPSGSCGSFVADGTCNAPSSVQVVSAACIGAASCSVAASPGLFAPVPCTGTVSVLRAPRICVLVSVSSCCCGVCSHVLCCPLACVLQPSGLTAQVTCAANTAWSSVSAAAAVPPARAYASMVAAPDGASAYLFGGALASGAVSNDLYQVSGLSGFADAQLGTPELRNLAASAAMTFQSSTNGSAVASLALVQSPAYFNSQGQVICSVTLVDTNPWWGVDLGVLQTIASVTVTQAVATAVPAGSLAGFQVFVGSQNTSWSDPSNIRCVNGAPDFYTTSATVTCSAPGRYVWVMAPGNRSLPLCGVQVWGATPWAWRSLTGSAQIATAKSVWTTGTYQAFGPANAVDGLIGNSMNQVPNTCFHSALGTTTLTPMISVDLGAVYDITSLVLYPRTDCCLARNLGWQIYIGNSKNPAFNTRCTNVPADVTPRPYLTTPTQGSALASYKTTVNCIATGRYVNIVRPYVASDGTTNNFLQLCELFVYGNRMRSLPIARMGHSATLYRGQMVVYGGTDGSGNVLSDVQV
jgi:hypothetical protein